jgi:hypothetical protein
MPSNMTVKEWEFKTLIEFILIINTGEGIVENPVWMITFTGVYFVWGECGLFVVLMNVAHIIVTVQKEKLSNVNFLFHVSTAY